MIDQTPTTDDGPTPYHHGNLKEALINGYLKLLEQEDATKISMRRLAKEIGVAPTAVYNHFKNKEELQIAVKTQCLNHFANYLDARHGDNCTDPKQAIAELGVAYFNYAQEHKQYFQLIMYSHLPNELVTEELIQAGMRAESALRNSVIFLLEENGLPGTQYNEGLGALACWSIAHGISSLAETQVNRAACIDGRWPPEFMLSSPEQVRQSFNAMSEVLVAGILAAAEKQL